MSLQRANLNAILAGGRRVAWGSPVTAEGQPPNSPLSGLDCRGAILGRLAVQPRALPAWREGRFEVETYDTSADWTLTLGGEDYTVLAAAHATAGELLIEMRDEVLGGDFTADCLDADGVVTDDDAEAVALRLRGPDARTYSIDWTASGSLVIEGTADAEGAQADVYVLPGGDTGAVQRWAHDESIAVGELGVFELLDLRSAARAAVSLRSVEGSLGDSADLVLTISAQVGAMRQSEAASG